jgi:hypothetical protein
MLCSNNPPNVIPNPVRFFERGEESAVSSILLKSRSLTRNKRGFSMIASDVFAVAFVAPLLFCEKLLPRPPIVCRPPFPHSLVIVSRHSHVH